MSRLSQLDALTRLRETWYDLGFEVALASGTFNHHAHAIADMIDERSAYVAPNGQAPSTHIAFIQPRLRSSVLIVHDYRVVKTQTRVLTNLS